MYNGDHFINDVINIDDIDIHSWVQYWFNDYCSSMIELKKFDLKDLYKDLTNTEVSIFADECLIDLINEFDLDEEDAEELRSQIEYDLENIIDDTLTSIENGDTPSFEVDMTNNNRYIQLEKRIRKLESALKNEFLGLFDKPKRADEKEWVSKLFTKFPSLKRALSSNDTSVDRLSEKKPFHLILTTRDRKYNGMYFIISTKGGRDDMYCTAFDKNDLKLSGLSKFNLDKEMNKCATFIIQTLQSNANEQLRRNKQRRKYENVPLTTFDCETIQQIIEDDFDDLPEIKVDVTDDNADYGFINVGIYNDEYLTDYDIIVNDATSVEVSQNDKKIGEADSLEDAADLLANHFMKNYINGKYNKEKK